MRDTYNTVITRVSSGGRGEHAGHRAFAKVCAKPTRGPLWVDRRLTLWIAGLVHSPGQQARLPLEVAHVGEALVDAGEAQVGDLVVGPEPLEDGMADLLARGLAAPAPDRLLQLGAEGVDVVLADGPV